MVGRLKGRTKEFMISTKKVNEKKALIDKCKFGNVFVTDIESPETLVKDGKLFKSYMTDESGEDVTIYKLNINEPAYVIKTGYSPLVGAYANLQTYIRDDTYCVILRRLSLHTATKREQVDILSFKGLNGLICP